MEDIRTQLRERKQKATTNFGFISYLQRFAYLDHIGLDMVRFGVRMKMG